MKLPTLPSLSSPVKSAIAIAVITGMVAACSTFLPILDDALRVVCRVTQGDAGLQIRIDRLYPDGATEPVDATIITD